ncbi:replication protein [Spartinivicinus ruber]|uniref:replication protein n=1 Tax=Spartinivicinus ruber TaxID=2683272 RepID=UPI0013D34445|nr:replication protein [Spartinivicinus ruber]
MYQQQDANIVTFPTAQPEGKKGFVMITNELLEASCKVKLSSRQHNILNAVIRKTIGFNRDFDWLAPQQIAELIDYDGDISHIYADLRVLKSRNILVADGKSIGVNLNVSEWELKKPVAKTSRKVPQNKQKTASNSGNSLAENSQHTSEKPLKKVAETCHLQNTIIHTTNNITPCSPPAGETSPKTEQVKPKPRSTKKRATAAPEDFPVTAELIQWASEKSIQVDLVIETEKFLDYHRAKGSTFKCWASAWRNWMRNAQKFANERGLVVPMQAQQTTTQTNWNTDLGW